MTIRFTAPLQMVFIEEGFDKIGTIVLPEETVADVRAAVLELGKTRAFGAVKVAVTVGASRWQTSLGATKGGGYFLPIKKPVRLAEGISEGDPVEVALELA
ncbi:MAG: hypothetical protein B7Z08_08275 [Sphingomonadales bacterium 32-68-7]|nr:MAG: hypothetical protein B7Z33_10065 [Sphingomonadales bacterium 12-68-11]OYX08709.1 MAG: hypothetical protein B7Z08_08275 [Sphingomonadales bacterium 32-68-7]